MPQKTIDEILQNYIGEVWVDEATQALADHILELPSLQVEDWKEESRINEIRQELAEALGVKEASGEAGE